METIKNAFAALQAWVTGSPYWATLVICILAGLVAFAAIAKETTITIPRTSDGLTIQQVIVPDPECMTLEALIEANEPSVIEAGVSLDVVIAKGEDAKGVYDLLNAVAEAPFAREEVDQIVWAENEASEWVRLFFFHEDGCIFKSFTLITSHPLYSVLTQLPLERIKLGKASTF